MLKIIGISIISILLVTCGNNEDGSIPALKDKIQKQQSKYFSSHINYSCKKNDENCNKNIALMAIKNKDGSISTCTVTLLTPTEAIVADSCFKDDIQSLDQNCDKKIEIHNTENKIASCQSVEVAYTSSSDERLLKIRINSRLSEDKYLISKNSSLKKNSQIYYFDQNQNNYFQINKNCTLEYNSIYEDNIVSNKSEHILTRNCTEKGVLYLNGILGIKSKDKIGINISCIKNNSCTVNSNSNISKIIKILRYYKKFKADDYASFEMLLKSKEKNDLFNTKYFDIKVTNINNNLIEIIATPNIKCQKKNFNGEKRIAHIILADVDELGVIKKIISHKEKNIFYFDTYLNIQYGNYDIINNNIPLVINNNTVKLNDNYHQIITDSDRIKFSFRKRYLYLNHFDQVFENLKVEKCK